jgi:hypothetical protein
MPVRVAMAAQTLLMRVAELALERAGSTCAC